MISTLKSSDDMYWPCKRGRCYSCLAVLKLTDPYMSREGRGLSPDQVEIR